MTLHHRFNLGFLAAAVFVLMSASARGVSETFAVFLLPVSKELGWSRAEAASVYAFGMLCLGLFSPVAGKLFDKFGPRFLFPLGMGCLAVGPILASQLEALWQFYLCLSLLVGFGAAALGIAVQSALLARWFQQSLTTAVAVVSGAAGVGVMIFSPVAQTFIDDLGWRNAYGSIGLIVICVGILVAIAPWQKISEGRADLRRPKTEGRHSPTSDWTFRRAVRSRPYWCLSAVHFLTAISMFAVQPQVVAFLIEQGTNPITAASAFGVSGISATCGLLIFGIIADRYGALLSVTLSYSLTISGYLLLFMMTVSPSNFLLWAFVISYGASFGSRGPVISALTARIFGRGRDLGLIMGAIFLCMGAGAAVGATMGGVIHDLTDGYIMVIAWSLTAICIPVAIFWTVPELKRAATKY
ncbi:MAG: MFS transporter [Alphaproteobacteria bacterium]